MAQQAGSAVKPLGGFAQSFMFHMIRDCFLRLLVVAAVELAIRCAVLPSAVTVDSMRTTRNMQAQGLPARWVAGAHREASVTLKAEQFCLGCHVKAQVGELLGTVTVRSHLQRKDALRWQEVRLTAGALNRHLERQKVAESGQQVLQRLAAGQGGPIEAHRA